jgi:hypothetical protein
LIGELELDLVAWLVGVKPGLTDGLAKSEKKKQFVVKG